MNLVVVPRLREPRSFGSDERSAFARGPNERRLRVVVDDAQLADPAVEALMPLRTHELLDVTTTTEAGPSVLRIDRSERIDDQIAVFTESADGSKSMSAIWPASTWLGWAKEHADRSGRDLDEEEHRYLLASAVDGRVDALLLRDPVFPQSIASHSNSMAAADGVAMVGLFLRSRDAAEVAIDERSRSTVAINTQRFIVSRVVLRHGWRWWSACVAAGDPLIRVGQGLQLRFERALRARDEVMIECLEGARGSAIEREVLYHFDAMLIWLGGAIDTTAQVAHRAYAMTTAGHLVGWRRAQWRDELDRVAPDLAAATTRGTPLRAVIDLVAAFRNTIHGEPLTGVTLSSGGEAEGLVQLPLDAEASALAEVEHLGGKEMWGFVHEGTGPIGGLWDPYRIAQVGLPFAAAALNTLMALTEVERLPGVDSSRLMSAPPDHDFFDPRLVSRLMALHGL